MVSPTKPDLNRIKILQGNTCSLSAVGKKERVLQKLNAGKYDICCLQETFISQGQAEKISMKPFYMYHRERDNDGSQNRGGVTIGVLDTGKWIHQKIHTSPVGCLAETITVTVGTPDGGEQTYVTSMYIRPGVKLEAQDLRDALPLNVIPEDAKWIICTDANAHIRAWDTHMGDNDGRGAVLLDLIVAESLIVENDASEPTRVVVKAKGTKNRVERSSPDVTLTRNVRVDSWDLEPNVDSDHKWITIEVGEVTVKEPTKRKFWVLAKAKWSVYAQILDAYLALDGKKTLESITTYMLKAMKKAVPKGSRADVVPLWSEKMTEAQQEAEKAAEEAKENPSEESIQKAKDKKEEMKEVFREEKRRLFKEKCDDKTIDVWALLRNRQPKKQASSNTVIKATEGDTTTELRTHRQKAEAFVRKFAKVSKRRGPVAEKCKVRGKAIPFTFDEFLQALRKMSRRKAVGPDELPIEAVENMSESAKRILLEAMNESYLTGDVPNMWRRGTIIPLLKPDKASDDIKSYRPVTLTSQISKLMERMIARRIVFAIEGKLCKAQFGFRAGLSTTDAIMEIIDELSRAYDNYNPRGAGYTFERALMLACDFSSAFDTIGHHEVMKQLKKLGCGEYEMRWVKSFLSGRQGRVQVGDVQSKWVDFEAGVPQGTVLGPLLFIVAINNLLEDLVTKGYKTATFADDLTVVLRDMDVDVCVGKAQKVLDIIEEWTKRSCMLLNVDKTFGMIFTHTTASSPFDKPKKSLKYMGTEVRIYEADDEEEEAMTFEKSRILGVHLDRRLCGKWQVEKVKTGAAKAKQAVSVLAGQTMGADTKQLCEFHVALSRSRELYAVETWWHLASDTARQQICASDREGIRKAVGLQPGASEQSLIAESNIRPLDIEIVMKQAMYYERCIRQGGSQAYRANRQPPAVSKQNSSDNRQYIQVPMNVCRLAAEKILRWGEMDPAKVVREQLHRVSLIAPWERTDDIKVKIVTEVCPGKTKKTTPLKEQKAIVDEVVRRHLETATVHGWTDGSSFIKQRRSGAAAVLLKKDANGEWKEVGKVGVPAGPLSCSFTSESIGLREMLQLLLDCTNEVIILFIDCQSLLKALDASSIDQKENRLIEIWKMMLMVGRLNTLILQHIWSHCDVKQSDVVDEEAKKAAAMEQDKNTTITYRDSRALIKSWGRAMTKKRMEGYAVPKGWGKTDDEKTWGRAAQVVAAQMRDCAERGQHKELIPGGGNVNGVGNWPRQFEPAMSVACRGCAPQDHVVIKKEDEQKGPRSSRDKVTCDKCKHPYPSLSHYNRHVESAKKCVEKGKAMQGNANYKECAGQPLLSIKNGKVSSSTEKGEKKPEEKKEKKVVERRPCTGERESLDHVLNKCGKMKELFGDTFGCTFKQKVDKIINIRDYFKAEREEAQKKNKRRAATFPPFQDAPPPHNTVK